MLSFHTCLFHVLILRLIMQTYIDKIHENWPCEQSVLTSNLVKRAREFYDAEQDDEVTSLYLRFLEWISCLQLNERVRPFDEESLTCGFASSSVKS